LITFFPDMRHWSQYYFLFSLLLDSDAERQKVNNFLKKHYQRKAEFVRVSFHVNTANLIRDTHASDWFFRCQLMDIVSFHQFWNKCTVKDLESMSSKSSLPWS
jgi:hypothetical protein